MTELRRDVGRWATVALVVNSMVGAGIVALPARVDALVGAHAMFALLACAVAVAAIALCFAEVSSRFEGTGGPYLYARSTFGPAVGFAVGWLMLISRFTTLPVLANVLADYAGFFHPPLSAGAPRFAVMAFAIAAFAAVNLWGVGKAARVTSFLTAGKLLPLAVFVAVGAFFIDPARLVPGPAPGSGAFVEAIILLLFAFSGFEVVTIAAGEMRDPRRNLPAGLVIAIVLVTALYLGILLVCRGTLPGLAESTRPLADAGARMLGPVAAVLISAAALVSAAGTISGSLLAGPRLFFAMARDGEMPRAFATVHPRWHTPAVAIVVVAAAAIALALTGTFRQLLGINVLTRLLAYLVTVAALIAHRRRSGRAAFTVAGGWLIPLLAGGSCIALIARSRATELRDVAIALAVGLGVRALVQVLRPRVPAG